MEWLLSTLASTAAGNWQQHSAIAGDLRHLHDSLPVIRVLIDRAEQWRFSNPNLERLLTQLKDAYYDAEDLIDDFAYHDLQQKIDGSQHGQASRLLSSSVTFFKNLIAAVPNQVKEIQGRLDAVSGELQKVIVLLNLHDEPKRYGVSAGRKTSSLVTESDAIGRNEEQEKVVALLLQSADGSGPSDDDDSSSSDRLSAPAKRRKRENVSVLPIVGIGGMGKTTLAQLVYNDPRVNDHFLLKIWVCVSDFFDVERLTKEIIDNAESGRQSKDIIESDDKGYRTDGRNLNSLQVLLNKMMVSTRFLLVLDDVWNEDRMTWEKFYAPLREAHRGSMIIITTRSRKVADIMGTMDSILLRGLPADSYWKLFERYAFGRENLQVNQELEGIAKKIAAKLKGSPLAAKTVGSLLNSDMGSLLNSDMDVGHWRTIMNSEIWELPQQENDILPALRLSYQYLPPHLKQCFSLCSIFPKDYRFPEDQLLDIWIAQGFVAPIENMPLHIVGTRYLHALTTRSFFQPYLPKQWNKYVIHDLMHDLAQLVLTNEAVMMQNDKCQRRIPPTVRHMSIWTLPNLETSWLMELSSYSKLWSLLLIQNNSFKFSQNLQPNFSSAIRCWFDQLRNIRLLIINYCKIKELPENISNLKHLRYLDISYNGIQMLPESLGRLYNLQVLAAYGNDFEGFPKEFTKLANLLKLYIEEHKLCMVDEIGKLTILKSLPAFKVLKEHGHRIGELKDLKQLYGKLRITCLENVESREDACQAKLHNKEHLDELVLEWSAIRKRSFMYDNFSQIEVLEGLQPHLNLKKLEIRCYGGEKSPTWLQPQILPYLSVLRIINCPNLAELSFLYPLLKELYLQNLGLDILPELWDEWSTGEARTEQGNSDIKRSSLSTLSIRCCPKIKSIENQLLPDYLPVIKILCIEHCKELASLPTERFKDFVSLEELTIIGCPKLTCQSTLELPASIRSLQIGSCGELEKSLPNCLENLTSLR
ncbi:disease resistance protein RGA2-like [Ananas comosus]|uniref:Disease resistance protein RGA2-like n=1 Tax=Ananas comosus TaxID=4615 RepID=A0A6P5EMP7_ANACO|nr:disease resistance protein RGA2-like [Ananas comosus]